MIEPTRNLLGTLPGVLLLAGCASTGGVPSGTCPFPSGVNVDHLIAPGETHFEHLWMLTEDGENAEAYWDSRGERLVFQRRAADLGIDCDRIFLMGPEGSWRQVSSGLGVTTCAFFMPGDESVIYASTRGGMLDCPPPIDPTEYRRLGYFWRVFPEYDLWVQDLAGGPPRRLTDEHGYDAEATVSPLGDRIVFTSTRSGDLDLWTCDLDGGNLVQVTRTPGYDGGAFFSHDGTKLVFRSQSFTPGKKEEELDAAKKLLAQWRVAPSLMEIQVSDVDGSNRRTLGPLGGANFAPYFFPDDRRVLFSTNHHDPEAGREFDLFAMDLDGGNLERITTHPGFDSFPMFSPDGRWLVFASNRGQKKPGETNLFLAEWR